MIWHINENCFKDWSQSTYQAISLVSWLEAINTIPINIQRYHINWIITGISKCVCIDNYNTIVIGYQIVYFKVVHVALRVVISLPIRPQPWHLNGMEWIYNNLCLPVFTSTKQGLMCLAQGNNTVLPGLKLTTFWYWVKQSTTEPLRYPTKHHI